MSFWRSHHWLRAALSLLLLFTHTGCTSWRTQPVAPATLVEERQPPAVRLTLQDGSKVVLHSPIVRGDTVVGLRQDSRVASGGSAGTASYGPESNPRIEPPPGASDTVTVPLHEIRTIALKKVDAGKSVGMVLAVVGVTVLMLVAACAATDCFEYNWGSYGNDSDAY